MNSSSIMDYDNYETFLKVFYGISLPKIRKLKIQSPVKQSRSPSRRIIQEDNWGIVSPIETPENHPCGLVLTNTKKRWVPLTQKIIDSWRQIE
jgi:DNA-directed RNA polymerase beta subunit